MSQLWRFLPDKIWEWREREGGRGRKGEGGEREGGRGRKGEGGREREEKEEGGGERSGRRWGRITSTTTSKT